MGLDSQIFFLIVVGGVVTIWSYRKAFRSVGDLKEIEYLAFACIWGTLLVVVYNWMPQVFFNHDIKVATINNPFVASVIFPIYGLVVGTFAGIIDRRFKISSKTRSLLRLAEKKAFED